MITKEFEAVVNDFKTAFITACGQFYPDFQFGSMFNKKKAGRAFLLSCANQAAYYIDGLFVNNVNCKAEADFFYILFTLNGIEGEVRIEFEADT